MNALVPQAMRFAVVGAVAVSIDFTLYRVLTMLTGFTDGSKAVSFMAATTLAYVLNRRWAFGGPGGSARLAGFVALYTSTFVVNVSVNAWMLWVLPGDLVVAFLTAQSASTTINFLILRVVIFRVSPKPLAAETERDVQVSVLR
ncbi:GtrA family protein [Actinomadura barringtoniae]|uniref:GtrA family protein n=1 Tax=Actinomadura barringtoniae TaxID=1427535 RepID=A0A939T6N6_9ACTN|nr:GtrA family protein [Actinomadura barringtoniae]MBO2452168.1 GtrA family protein [Actinomadura barringtoniae]